MERRVLLSGGPFDGQVITMDTTGPVIEVPEYFVPDFTSLLDPSKDFADRRVRFHRYQLARPVSRRGVRVYQYTPNP